MTAELPPMSLDAARAEISRLRAELEKYQGHEPTVREEMAYIQSENRRMETALGVVVEHVLQMSTSWETHLRRQAHAMMRDLDEAGVNIDERVDVLSRQHGKGPYLCDMLGHRYDLAKQWLDRRGKRWEHTGDWSDVGGPVMRRDVPNGDVLVLAELVREYGPLSTAVPAPPAPVNVGEMAPF